MVLETLGRWEQADDKYSEGFAALDDEAQRDYLARKQRAFQVGLVPATDVTEATTELRTCLHPGIILFHFSPVRQGWAKSCADASREKQTRRRSMAWTTRKLDGATSVNFARQSGAGYTRTARGRRVARESNSALVVTQMLPTAGLKRRLTLPLDLHASQHARARP